MSDNSGAEIIETGLTLQSNATEVISVIEQTDNMYLSVLDALNLPTDGVLSTVDERRAAIRNIPDIVGKLDSLDDAYYLSKFLVAVSAGLFDAALNYLWDETIKQLRIRICGGDVKYFYDIVIPDSRIKDFKSSEDIVKLDDATLITGALKIGLIGEIGFRHLDYIRYMRNWTSAAHPNQTELTGINLVSWLETCIREVISTPISNVQIRINQLLGNIKTQQIEETEAETISAFFTELSQEKCDALAKGLFGIYIHSDSTQQTITNINLIAPNLWPLVSEDARSDFGTRCATFIANGEQHSQHTSRRFLELVGGLSYLPDGVKVPQLKTAIEDLLSVHNGLNNFYNEPSMARQLKSIVGQHGNVPVQLNYSYTRVLVTVFLTNGHGVAWSAEPIYIDLIRNFDAKQSYLALTSFRDEFIKSKLQFNLCKEKFSEMLTLIRPSITSEGVLSLFEEVEKKVDSLSAISESSPLFEKIHLFDKKYKDAQI
jgi:hypothetical protein